MMPWLLDELLEAALGPWGLVIGAALGLGMLARRRQPRPGRRRLMPDIGRLASAGLGAWWRDVYTEARAEWEADRGARSTEATVVRRGRVRDARGRFVRSATAR